MPRSTIPIERGSTLNRILIYALVLSFPGFMGCAEGPDASSDPITLSVDPAVELISIIYRLAGMRQYDLRELPSYIDDIEEHFHSFRNHRAVEMTRDLAENHRINGSAPMALAVYLNFPELEGEVPLTPPPADLDFRWTPGIITEFLSAVRDFASVSSFGEFYASRSEYYDLSVESLRSSLEGHDILPWLQEFFGEEPERYAIIVGMQQGYGNYGLSSTSEDGSVEYISIIGANSPSIFRKVPSFSHWWFIPTVVHEFAHSFVNPAVYENETTLEDVAEELFPYHREKMMEQGYSSWQHMVFEYLVRASVNRYLLEHEDGNGYRRRIEADESQGFPGITLLTDCLDEYEENRDRYPKLEAFMPKVAGCFEELLRGLRDEEDYGAQTGF